LSRENTGLAERSPKRREEKGKRSIFGAGKKVARQKMLLIKGRLGQGKGVKAGGKKSPGSPKKMAVREVGGGPLCERKRRRRAREMVSERK